MARNRKPHPILEKVRVDVAGSEGKCLIKGGEKVIFVPFTAPGDIVDVQVYKKRRRYLEGRVLNFHEYSDLRVDPKCKHFGTCGGCKWQHLNYEEQLKNKQSQVAHNLKNIGKVDNFEILPIIGCEENFYYRNKMEYSFSARPWYTNPDDKTDNREQALGFHVPGRYDKVLHLNECHLMDSKADIIRNTVYDFAVKNNMSFYDAVEKKGLLRTLMVRNTIAGEWMVVLSYSFKDELILKLLSHLKTQCPFITSLQFVMNTKSNDTIYDLDVETFEGEDFITEKIGDLSFKVGPKSFFQTNPVQANALYKATMEMANLDKSKKVFDLYTGTGTLALIAAKNCEKVLGIESVGEAIKAAKESARRNKLNNTEFIVGDMRDVLNEEFIANNFKPDVIITDPPRDGMHPKVVDRLLEIKADTIVYISCKPATQARDIEKLKEKYTVVKIQTVDMFPHTHHVENIALLTLKK